MTKIWNQDWRGCINIQLKCTNTSVRQCGDETRVEETVFFTSFSVRFKQITSSMGATKSTSLVDVEPNTLCIKD